MVAKRVAFYLLLLLLLFPGHISVTSAAAPERIIPNPRDQQRIQEIVNEFMAKLTYGA